MTKLGRLIMMIKGLVMTAALPVTAPIAHAAYRIQYR